MAPVNQIKQQLARYAAAEISLADFQQWLDQADLMGDNEAEGLKSQIEWKFCDLDRGFVNESGLLDGLVSLASNESSGSQVLAATARVIVFDGGFYQATACDRRAGNNAEPNFALPPASGSFL